MKSGFVQFAVADFQRRDEGDLAYFRAFCLNGNLRPFGHLFLKIVRKRIQRGILASQVAITIIGRLKCAFFVDFHSGQRAFFIEVCLKFLR